jgi:hypothetical protein
MNGAEPSRQTPPAAEFFQESAESGAASAPSPAASVIYKKVLLQFPFADLHANPCSTNLQINSPHRIALALLQPFVEQRKRLLLVTPTLPTTPATLTALHDNFLRATTDCARQFARAHGQRIVIVFPISPTQSYSLQTTLTDTSMTQVTLHYQDPRYEPRRRFLSVAPVLLRLAPPSFPEGIPLDQVDFIRVIKRRREEPAAGTRSYLEDWLQGPQPSSHAIHDLFRKVLPLSCGLRDISCGGICLNLPAGRQHGGWARRVVALEIPLPALAHERSQELFMSTLCPLGLIRAVRVEPPTVVVHIRFLKSLPEQLGIVFERLEHAFPQADA